MKKIEKKKKMKDKKIPYNSTQLKDLGIFIENNEKEKQNHEFHKDE